MAALSDDPTAASGVDFTVTQWVADADTEDHEGNGSLAAAEPPQPPPAEGASGLAAPVSAPVVIAKRLVHGRYRSAGTGFQLELRVDVDGPRPLKRVSGDFFTVSGASTSYYGSFAVNAPTVTSTPTQIVIEGTGTFTRATTAKRVRVTIPRVTVLQPAADATVQFITPPSTLGAKYTCAFASPFFRTIVWEQDRVAGTVPFSAYDTAALPVPVGSPTGVLDVQRAFGLAGLQVIPSGGGNVIPVNAAGADLKWTDAELHAAMVTHFSGYKAAPQWRVWLLVATEHVSGYRGIMFDATDAHQRQGAAVFHNAIAGPGAADQRAQLRTYVHELGHAFNLLHSWQKNLADPPAPLGPNGGFGDLSWMNYTWQYQPTPPAPGGDAAYWAAFPFQFTANELAHLRHGYYANVVMGANPFGKGAAEVDPDEFDAPAEDRSGLALELRPKPSYAYGEPVVVELKLSTTDIRGTSAHGFLHPNDDFVAIAIRQPSGRTVLFRPMLRHCADEDRTERLDATRPAIYASAFIGHGRDGAYFEQPGRYALRGVYRAADGSRVVSPVAELRVQRPLTAADEEAGELLMGDQQGQLLTLLGSESSHLSAGNAALDELLERHGSHPLATFARLAKGVTAARDFKCVTDEKTVEVIPARPSESIAMLTDVAEASRGDGGVDNITLNFAIRRRAAAEVKAGDVEQAAQTLDSLPEVFAAKGVKPAVLDTIRLQAETAKANLLG